MKKMLRDVRPDIFNMIKDKNKYNEIASRCQDSIEFICPRCGNTVKQIVSNVVRRGLSCKRCGDGISFGEKFICNLLDQLNLKFNTHVKFPWSDNRIYDICIYDDLFKRKYLIEIHGAQHYQRGFECVGGRTYQEEVDNDAYKMQLAIENGFDENTYFVIDCKESTIEYIKNSIYNNMFFQQYNLDVVNWNLCIQNATSSYAIKAQQLWEEGYKMGEICDILKLCSVTICKYLKNGAKNGTCSYTVDEAHRRSWKKGGATRRTSNYYVNLKNRKVFCPELNKLFNSITDASIQTGVSQTHINYIMSGERKRAKKTKYGFPLTFIDASSLSICNNIVTIQND